MSDIWSDVEGGLKTLVDEQKEAEGDANLTLILFDGDDPAEFVIDGKDVQDVEFSLTGYSPRGMTPLRDAMMRAMNHIGSKLDAMHEDNKPGKVVFITYTDGLENASRETDGATLRDKVTEQTDKYDWDFVFLGADIDAITEGGNMGFSGGNTIAISKGNTRAAIANVSGHLASYRSIGGTKADLAYSEEERESLK